MKPGRGKAVALAVMAFGVLIFVAWVLAAIFQSGPERRPEMEGVDFIPPVPRG